MIWYTREFTLDKQPEAVSVQLEGSYNSPETNLPRILIRICIDNPDESLVVRNLFYKNPSMMRQEDPEPEDVLHKYSHKIQPIVAKIEGMDYDELVSWCASL